jgi:DNA/RNA-binding domain of Phe-tRNA-synthetase-like protein
MIDLSISQDLKSPIPATAVGVLTATVTVRPSDPSLWAEVQDAVAHRSGLTTESVRRLAPIQATWKAYKTLGQDPTRYRGSAESLYRRVVQGKGLYPINTIVDLNNLVSLESMFCCGTTDLAHVRPPVVFRVGREQEAYDGIGRGQIRLAKIPVFADTRGPFASTTSDSQQAKVTLETSQLLMLIISFGGPAGLDEALARSGLLLTKYALAATIDTRVVA